MRLRLGLLILGLLVIVLVATGVPLALGIRNTLARDAFLDQLNDTARFASAAEQAETPDQMAKIETQLRRYEVVHHADCFVLAADRTVLLAASDSDLPRDPPSDERISEAIRGRRGVLPPTIWPWTSQPLLVVEPMMRGGEVVGAMVIVSSTDGLRRQIFLAWAGLLICGLAALLACAYMANRLTRWVLRPVHELDVATHEVATGRLDARVPEATGPPELRRLATSFNEMATQVQISVAQQQNLVADVSHQMRNPLAALLLRLDDLATRAPDELRSDAERALLEGRGLAEIAEQLLALARAEHAGNTAADCDMTAMVGQRMQTWEPIARARGVSLALTGSPRLHGWFDKADAAGAFDAVIDNAIKYSPVGSTVTIFIGIDGDFATIVVRDFGPGLSPDELARIGSRFWRSPSARGIGGFGLGLSIAKALLDRTDGSCEFSLPEGGGLQARILLPLTEHSPSATRSAAAPAS
ncbi:sensor histidine kinase [Jatrophihabitans sp. DSM 45814]